MPRQPAIADVQTVVELLRGRALAQPTRRGYTFVPDLGNEGVSLTYQELDRRARAIGAWLQSEALAGERAILLFPSGLDFLVAFFGCLYAQVIAVPLMPPRPNRSLRKFETILADSGAKRVLTTEALRARLQRIFLGEEGKSALRWLAIEQAPEGVEQAWVNPGVSCNTIALLQYTSGSTAMPKGVMISHSNILHNSAQIYTQFGHHSESTLVSWLPFYHDMGLTGGILQPLYGGFPGVFLSPASFIHNPYRWLQTISRYGATTSGGPNFGYEACLCAITPELTASLDLRSWKVAFNGAEPIRATTMERFAQTFAPAGFRWEAFYPCYGLAEGTLMVTVTDSHGPRLKTVSGQARELHHVVEVSSTHPDAKTLVSSGRVIHDQKIVIVDPHTLQLCPDGTVGEIWVSGPSVAQGYWNRHIESLDTFQAIVEGSSEGIKYLRTGDLGFLDHGELYVTGRLKDLLIIQGRNYYPQDIEWTARHSHFMLEGGATAAFTIDIFDEERLIVVQELPSHGYPHRENLVSCIRIAVAHEHNLEVFGVVFIKIGTLPKTSSGKIERHTCKTKYREGILHPVGGWQAELVTSMLSTVSCVSNHE